jgi:hypothetical protein
MSHLIYVNGLGPNYKGNRIYEFIFSKTSEYWQDDWDGDIANGNPTPPEIESIEFIGTLNKEDIELELIQNSDFFSMKDGVDNVVALAWEKDKDIDKRLVFHFGDSLEKVKDKLYEKDLILDIKKNEYQLEK